MANQNTRKIGQRPAAKRISKMDTLHDTWTVMKPFVHFSVKAMRVIARAVIFIVRNIPKPENQKSESKNDKVIKLH